MLKAEKCQSGSDFQLFSVSEFQRFVRELLANSCRFFAFSATKIVQLRAAGFAFGLDLDLGDARGIEWENAFDAFAVGNSPHRKSFVQTTALPTDNDSRKDLDAFLISLNDASMHANTVADFKLRAVALLLLLFDDIDNTVHNFQPAAGAGGRTLSIERTENANARCQSSFLLLFAPTRRFEHEHD